MTVIYLSDIRCSRVHADGVNPDQIALGLLSLVAAYGTRDRDDRNGRICRYRDLVVSRTALADGERVVTVSSHARGGDVDLFCASIRQTASGRSVKVGYCEPGNWPARIAAAFTAFPAKRARRP